MASTGAAIISAQGDASSSVWAFRQTQVTSGGGGVTRLLSGNVNLTLTPSTGVGDVTLTVQAPVIQYGRLSGVIGASGSSPVPIPNAYTNETTYVVQVTMLDAPAAQLYATPVSGTSFIIGWQSAGGGPQTIMWTTFGT